MSDLARSVFDQLESLNVASSPTATRPVTNNEPHKTTSQSNSFPSKSHPNERKSAHAFGNDTRDSGKPAKTRRPRSKSPNHRNDSRKLPFNRNDARRPKSSSYRNDSQRHSNYPNNSQDRNRSYSNNRTDQRPRQNEPSHNARTADGPLPLDFSSLNPSLKGNKSNKYGTQELECPNKRTRNEESEENHQGIKNKQKHQPKSRLSYPRLEELAKQDSLKITIELANAYNGFEYLMEQESFLKERPDWIILISELLAKVCNCEFPENKIKVLTWVCESNFIEMILGYLLSLSADTKAHYKRLKTLNTFLQNVMTLLETLISIFQNVAKERFHDPVIKIFGHISSIECLAEVKVEESIKSELTAVARRLQSMGTSAERMNEKKNQYLDEGNPPEDFRDMSLYPTPEEVLQEVKVFLRRSIVDGGYADVEHYLDVQFRLLRQDLIEPLRTGFKDLISSLTSEDKRRKRINNLRLFKQCAFKKIVSKYDKISYVVCFDVDRKININWEYNRWFMFGSLLFFSFDNFSTFFMGTVHEKNNKTIAADRTITVELIGDIELHVEEFEKDVMMAESTIFFQPYYHVMKALKQFDEKNFPMKRYIVEVNRVIKPPSYLNNNSYIQIGNFAEFDILNEYAWPSSDQFGLDKYQFEAYKAALTREFVIMQGPPGTGKTFLGLKIIETFLKNDNIMDNLGAPILLVCYTNHALDQFLEGILKYTNSIVRVGSQSKSELIKPYELNERRKNFRYDQGLNSAYITIREEMKNIISYMKTLEAALNNTDVPGIIKHEYLVSYMSPSHQNQLKSSNDFVQWLLVRNHVGNACDIAIDEQGEDDSADEENASNETKNENKNEEDTDDDEARNQLRHDNSLVGDLVIDETKMSVHIATIESLERQLGKLEKTCEVIENQRMMHSHAVYVRMRNDVEVKWKQLVEAIKILGSQFKRLNKNIHVRDCTLLNTNLMKMNLNERWNMYWNWFTNFKAELMTAIKNTEASYRLVYEQYGEAKQLQDMQVLLNHRILGTTTTTAAKYHLMLAALKPKIVVVEEAAEVLEAHIVTALTNHCEHLILIGDHQQLRPNPTVYELAKKYNLEVSLFERMIKNKLSYSTLGVQHRMRPEIADLITPVIYPNLQNHISVYDYESVRGVTKNLFFVTHEVPEESDEHIQSYKNSYEGEFVLKLARYLLFQGYSPDQITILTTYSGQMIFLKMQKKKMPEIRDVRICTVDNYQGEECQIILLSLVRSNPEHKIGFLSIPNRVCVALSRAKHGFYLIGNMTALEESSQIWPNIKKQLEMHQAIGPALELQCIVHKNTTLVSKKSDFLSVTEGGCSQMCDEPLNCGHSCKSLCHPTDRNHELYKCPQACSKSCPAGHPCRNRCYEECSLCRVLVTRQLQCGHTVDLHCYIDPSSYPCKVSVQRVIEQCGHVAQIACHVATSNETIRCTKPCEMRLQCGHACTNFCHVDDDPDHLEFKCLKPCERKNANCSGEHYCKKMCHEKCSPCNERVAKQLLCDHEQIVLCHLEVDFIECTKPCTNILDCSHKCRKRCLDPCGDCNVMVKKQIVDCGHTVDIKCKSYPERKFCKSSCDKQLTCGHRCAKKCRDECNANDCIVLVDCSTVESLCGHPAKVPCRDKLKSMTELMKLALENCPEPCRDILLCEHACQGSCSKCKQGRLHEMCKEKCGRVKICGHSCNVDCSALCPPCKLPCMTRCPHSKCNNPCGEKCPNCQERCAWQCQHKKCRKKCSEICSRGRCYRPCPEKLPCEHDCIGFCGEPCPKVCRICNEDEVTFIFFGTEDEEGARFVVLEDCDHFFESKAIETHFGIKHQLSDQDREIVMLTCPKCKTPVVNTLRFMNQTRKILKDIAEVKKKQNGLRRNIVKMKMDVIRRLRDLELFTHAQEEKKKFICSSKFYTSIIRHVNSQLQDFYTQDRSGKQIKRQNFVTEVQLNLYAFIVDCLETIRSRVFKLGSLTGLASCSLLSQIDEILLYIRGIPNVKISEQQKFDIYCEIDRFFALANLLEMKSHENIRNGIVLNLAELNNDFEKCTNEILCLNRFDKERSEAVNNLLAQVERKMRETIDLKAMIRLAMSLTEGTNQQGHWYKCRNGHYYYIGNCGGAVMTAKCPDCKETVGGSGHQLTAGNSAAPEMMR